MENDKISAYQVGGGKILIDQEDQEEDEHVKGLQDQIFKLKKVAVVLYDKTDACETQLLKLKGDNDKKKRKVNAIDD